MADTGVSGPPAGEELSCASATPRLSQDGASSFLDIAGLMIHQIQRMDKPPFTCSSLAQHDSI